MSKLSDETQQSEHEHIDPVFKQILVEMSDQLKVPLETQIEMNHLPQTVDGVMKLTTKEEIARVEAETPFIRLRPNSQVEFKAINDPLTLAGYHLIRGRTHLYLGGHDLSASQMSVTIVSAAKPITVLSHRPDDVLFKKIEKGYYINSTKPPVVIIVINELPIIPKNYPFLLFAASEKKFREFVRRLIKVAYISYVHYAYRVRPEVTKEELKMLTKDPYLSDKDFRFIAQDIGPQLVTYLSVEDRLAGLAPQERVAGLSLEERLADQAPEEIEAYLKRVKTKPSPYPKSAKK